MIFGEKYGARKKTRIRFDGISQGQGQLEPGDRNFFDMMILDEEKKKIPDAPHARADAQHHQMGVRHDMLQLSFFMVVGQKAAAYLCLDYHERHLGLTLFRFDPAIQGILPGWVLLAYLIQHAIQTGKRTFDFNAAVTRITSTVSARRMILS